MKKTIVTSLLFLTASILFAQQKDTSFFNKRNEIKVNLPVSIFAEFMDVSYERVLQEDISIGASLGCSLSNGGYAGLKYQIAPYFRWFFGGSSESARKYAAGFFIEANSSVFSRNDHKVYIDDKLVKDSKFGAGLGIGIGWKYVSKNNWCGEISFGGGRDFLNDGGYPRFGISIGKRF